MNNSTVSACLRLRLVISPDLDVPIAGSITYRAEDPYAVQVCFHAGMDETVEWIFARDLLARGAAGFTGAGDVKVWPSADRTVGRTGPVLNIQLCSPFGEARFETPADEISRFLRRTYEVVPAGRESDHVDVERALSELLRQAF